MVSSNASSTSSSDSSSNVFSSVRLVNEFDERANRRKTLLSLGAGSCDVWLEEIFASGISWGGTYMPSFKGESLISSLKRTDFDRLRREPLRLELLSESSESFASTSLSYIKFVVSSNKST